MSPEQEAQALLGKLGVGRVKFTGRMPYKGKQRMMYTLANGGVVMDAPVILVDSRDRIELRPWDDQLR